MRTDLVEELFASIVATSPGRREKVIASSKYPRVVKEAAARLVQAYESKSQLLNDDLLSDIAKADPDFFTSDQSSSDIKLRPGDKVKDYVIESVIGEGGMSVVYKAVQTQPIKRRVAIKLIRPSILAPKTVLRFFREQQALALIVHPHVSTLYEVGVTEHGHPFAAMEIVNGLPISAFCDRHQLESRQRLILFLQACAGLRHAHRHGIVHRDVKPDNILVGIRDRKPVAKLIDFGIAKFHRADMKDNPTVTQPGQVLGSPRYMSPEQFAGKPVDQRSDVYSAALVLFELLARAPYREGHETEDVLEQIKLCDPERLSHRIKHKLKNQGPAEFANDDPASLLRFVRRDLDWIITRALSEDPEQRYQTMNGFVKDLTATLRDQPVSVSRPNSVWLVKRFARANRKWLVAMLVVGLVSASTFGFYRLRFSQSQLTAARQANSDSSQQTAAANDLVMRLLASDMYELTTDQFDLGLIPAYQSQYEQIRSRGGPATNEAKTVYGILAVLYAMSGDFDLADDLMIQVSDDQESDLRQVREKICAEYAATAKQKLALLTNEDDGEERALQQMTLGKCYIVWNMLDDSNKLLSDSIEFFDQHDPNCYESLAARNALVRVHRQAGQTEAQHQLLRTTYGMFKDNQALLESPRGRDAFSHVVSGLRELNSDLVDSPEQ